MCPVFALCCSPVPTQSQHCQQDRMPVSPVPSHSRDSVSPCPVTLLVIRLKGTRWSESYLCWHSEFPLFISFSLKGFQIAFSYLAYGDFHFCDRLILLSGIYKDLQYQCTPHAAQDFSQNKHWQRDRMSSEQFFLLFPVPPFLGCAEAGQYNKGCENTNALPKHFLQGWVVMDAGPLKELSTWGSSVLVRWGYSSQNSPASRWTAIGKGRGERHWTLQEICREETDTGFAK